MLTPLIIVSILIIPFLVLRKNSGSHGAKIGGIIGLSIAFTFFGIGHFILTVPMSQMLPSWVPAPIPLVYVTGLLEFAIALSLAISAAIPRWRRPIGWVCIAVLIGFFPVNVYAALNHIGMGGHLWGPVYLFVRAPLQLMLILWTYWFMLRSASEHK